MKSTLFLMLVCCSSRLIAQQEPIAFVSAGKGYSMMSSEPWKLDLNASVLGGYRLGSGIMVIAYFDYIGHSFTGYYNGSLFYTANRSTFSMLTGVKLSAFIPNKSVSPYFMSAIGVSKTTSTRDSVFEYTGGTGQLILLRVSLGTTASYLAAVGVDIEIYRGITAFGEVRASAGFKTSIYDFLLLARAGLGIAIY